MEHEEARKLDRLVFFSDAVFAIAMTLLVIDVRLPDAIMASNLSLAQELWKLVPRFIGFCISFLVIGRFWAAHHRLFGLASRADESVIRANLLFLMTIAFMPFPTAVLSNNPTLRLSIGFYTGFLLLVSLANIWLTTATLAQENEAVDEMTAIRRLVWAPVVIAAAGFTAGMITPLAGPIVLTLSTPLVLMFLARQGHKKVGELRSRTDQAA